MRNVASAVPRVVHVHHSVVITQTPAGTALILIKTGSSVFPGSAAQASAPRAPSSDALNALGPRYPLALETQKEHMCQNALLLLLLLFSPFMGACVGLLGSLSFFFFFYALTSIYAVEKYPDTNARRTNRSRYMHYSRLLGLPMRTLPNLGRRCSVVSFAYALHTSEALQHALRPHERSDRCGVLQF